MCDLAGVQLIVMFGRRQNSGEFFVMYNRITNVPGEPGNNKHGDETPLSNEHRSILREGYLKKIGIFKTEHEQLPIYMLTHRGLANWLCAKNFCRYLTCKEIVPFFGA